MDRVKGGHWWAAQLTLRGISRAEAAGALHLSRSQLNKKLRGQARLYEEERQKLRRLLQDRQKGGVRA